MEGGVVVVDGCFGVAALRLAVFGEEDDVFGAVLGR